MGQTGDAWKRGLVEIVVVFMPSHAVFPLYVLVLAR